MYLEFFKLKEFPFSNTSDERFFFQSDIHAEALSNMMYTIQQRKGMVLITGEVGAGKTFLGNMLASRLGISAMVATVKHPTGSAKQLLRAVAAGLGVKASASSDTLTLLDELEQGLLKLYRRSRLAALVLDEVQDLADETMEEIRLLWNWEEDGQRLLQIVLIGQPELRDRLRDGRWESLRQRIVLSYHLGRLSFEDTSRYILHRRQVAAEDDCLLRFTPNAIQDIYEATSGVPRLINTLCDNALLTAYSRGEHKITSSIVATVVRDMTCWSLNAPPAPAPAEAPPERPAPVPNEPQPALQDPPNPAGGRERRLEQSPAVLRAALQGEPSLEMARQVYEIAPQGSETHHLAVRIIARELISALRAGR